LCNATVIPGTCTISNCSIHLYLQTVSLILFRTLQCCCMLPCRGDYITIHNVDATCFDPLGSTISRSSR
jgi:hypothetical protein